MNKTNEDNLSKLTPGMIIKNYRQLCKLLDEPVKGGDSKKAQLKDWARYFSFTKVEGQNSFQINEVYNMKKDAINNAGRKPIYANHIQTLLINYLFTKYHHAATLPVNKWYEVLGIINRKYYIKPFDEVLKQDSRIKQFNYDDFDFLCNKKFSTTFISCLDSMRKKGIIDYEIKYIVMWRNIGERFCKCYANEALVECIKYAESTAIAELNRRRELDMKTKSDVFKRRLYTEYKELYKICLKKLYNIYNTKRVIKITYLQNDINRVLTHDDLEDERRDLNASLKDYVMNVFKNRYEKWEQGYNNGTYNTYQYNYLYYQKQIADLLLTSPRRRESIYDWRNDLDEIYDTNLNQDNPYYDILEQIKYNAASIDKARKSTQETKRIIDEAIKAMDTFTDPELDEFFKQLTE